MASTSELNGVGSIYQELYATQERTLNKSLGKDEFLKILVAQLANQDPMNPTNDTEFIAQMAQFSALEQMQQLNTTLNSGQAYSLVGKYVYVTDTSEGYEQLFMGKVDGVINEQGVSYLIVGEGKYDMSKVVGVVDVREPNTTLEEMIAQGAGLIGKTVSASYTNDEGETVQVQGVVTKIVIEDSSVYAMVDDQKVALASITEVQA